MLDSLKKFGITKSKGVFRTVASVLLVAAAMPQLAQYSDLLIQAATWLGGLGVVKAVVSK